MKRFTITRRRGLVALVLFALALTGCAGAAPQELPSLTKQVQIEKLDCAAVKNALERLDAVAKSTATDAEKKAFKAESGVNPSDKKAVKKLREQLKDRRTVACEADRQFTVPANEEDVNASAFNALVNRCGAALDRSSTAAPAKDDKASYLLKGKGPGVQSWRSYQCTLMKNPTVTDAWGDAISGLKTPSGSTGKELNADWLPAALEKGQDSLAEAWLEKRSDTNPDLYVTPDFQKFAFKIITILDRLEKRRGEGTTVWSYELQAFEADAVPHAVRTKKGYWGEFILLKYTPKGWSCASVVLGINVRDGRPAGLKTYCSTSGKPTGNPPGSPPGKDKPGCKGDKCKPPSGCKVNCGNNAKDPSKDPARKGNAGNGGGRNQDPGPGATTKPTRPPATPRVNPTQPAPAPQPTRTAPAPEPSAPKPSNPATGCAPAPGRTCP